MTPIEFRNIAEALVGKDRGWQSAMATRLFDLTGKTYTQKRISDFCNGHRDIPYEVRAVLRHPEAVRVTRVEYSFRDIMDCAVVEEAKKADGAYRYQVWESDGTTGICLAKINNMTLAEEIVAMLTRRHAETGFSFLETKSDTLEGNGE